MNHHEREWQRRSLDDGRILIRINVSHHLPHHVSRFLESHLIVPNIVQVYRVPALVLPPDNVLNLKEDGLKRRLR